MEDELTNEVKASLPLEEIEDPALSPLPLPIAIRDITVHTSGHIKGGQTAYDTGKGFYIGYDSTKDKYVFSIGDSAGDNVTWDGTTLSISSSDIGIRLDLPFSELVEINSAASGGSGSKDNFEWKLDVDTGAGTTGGLRDDSQKLDITRDFTFETIVKTDAFTTTGSIIVGLKGSTSEVSGTGVPDQAGSMTEDHAGFVFFNDSGSPGRKLFASVSDGSTQNKTEITGITITNNNRYRIKRTGSSIEFLVNGTSQATLTTNLPDDTTNVVAWMGAETPVITVRQQWFYQEPL